MSINISFGGVTIKRPGAYSTVDSSGMVPVTLGSLKVLAVIGQLGTGATIAAGTIAYFNDPKLAASAVGQGEMLEVMNVAWRHGADLIAVSAAAVTAPATAPTDAEWQAAIDLLQPEEVSGIIPLTTQAAVWAKVDTHITLMSSTKNRKRRRAFYGHATGTSIADIKTAAAAIPGERGLLATPCPLVADSAGNKVAKPGYYMAAAIAGLWAGQESQQPVTYKLVKFDGLEKVYIGQEIETLLEAHVCPVESVKNVGFRIVQGVTLSASEDLTQSELSVSTLKDDMSANLESFFETRYVGTPAIKGIEVIIYNDLITLIQGFEKNGWISGFIPESLKVTRNGTVFTLEWEGIPTLPINNFLITSHFTLK
ncbi:phage tail sheath subtilisin-like domain-containing protein [Paenibacillus graminis]|uniref:phage tail sheath subtilisin-like domain-containing protein n=1 Tax=Paenibacillus graminis TaxID=189425 RepID=UPI002DBB5255|nr:phage tail sheath subtilisin-like domain-containing protein [Paenibacillus graminis]MEC0169914.1 phage tail sheath subtilisin-like domain-containing protein [Paenibacillus graminis]